MRYQETRYNADGSRNFSAPVEVHDGQHEALIQRDLFQRCQEVRETRSAHHLPYHRYTPYLLRGLVYCYRCCTNPPENADFPSWGRMVCQTRARKTPSAYYRCNGRAQGFPCEQRGVRVGTIDEQVIGILLTLKPPADWQERILATMSAALGEKNLEDRLSEIRAAIERMDFRWDNGFITDKGDYVEKRLRLQQELEELAPVEDEMQVAADLLINFPKRWSECDGDIERQHSLVKLVVERVYVNDDQVVAITLRSNFHIVLGHNGNGPTYLEVDPMVHTWARRGWDTRVYRVAFIPKYLRFGGLRKLRP